MRVLVITNLFPNPLQPHRAPWNRAQLGALARDHEIRVIAPIAWTDEWASRRIPGRRIERDRRSSCDGINVDHPRYFFTPKIWRGAYGDFFRLSIKPAFHRIYKDFLPDVILGSWAYPDAWAAAKLAHKFGVPVVAKVHGSDVQSLEKHSGRRRRTIEALKAASRVVVVSRDLGEKVVEMGLPRDNVRIVRNGLNTDIFRPGSQHGARRRLNLPRDVPQILFVGNLADVKQVDVLLKACAQLRETGESFHCNLVGDGPLRRDLENLTNLLDLKAHVSFHGQRPQSELVEWYRSANVVALPSRSEGIPNVLLEAVACGTPFVASRVGGIPEIEAGQLSKLVAPGDVKAMADALAPALLESRSDSIRPGRATSWEESAKSLEAVLQEAVQATR